MFDREKRVEGHFLPRFFGGGVGAELRDITEFVLELDPDFSLAENGQLGSLLQQSHFSLRVGYLR